MLSKIKKMQLLSNLLFLENLYHRNLFILLTELENFIFWQPNLAILLRKTVLQINPDGRQVRP
jgi:hypothetical protein